jgi:hypothetical protein
VSGAGIDQLTVAFVENGTEKVRELDKMVLSQSTSWATLAFLFQELDAATGTWKPQKVGLRRYKKRGGRFVVDKHFVVSSDRQAHALLDALSRWFPDAPPATSADADDDD